MNGREHGGSDPVAYATRLADLSPVSALPLEELTCPEPMARKNGPVLAEIKTLKTINGRPAAEFWKLEPNRTDQIYAALREAGVTAVVAHEAPPPEHAAGWRRGDAGTRWVRFLTGDR